VNAVYDFSLIGHGVQYLQPPSLLPIPLHLLSLPSITFFLIHSCSLSSNSDLPCIYFGVA
jgi:hypothetical protein